jgi:hypothetical protein
MRQHDKARRLSPFAVDREVSMANSSEPLLFSPSASPSRITPNRPRAAQWPSPSHYRSVHIVPSLLLFGFNNLVRQTDNSSRLMNPVARHRLPPGRSLTVLGKVSEKDRRFLISTVRCCCRSGKRRPASKSLSNPTAGDGNLRRCRHAAVSTARITSAAGMISATVSSAF